MCGLAGIWDGAANLPADELAALTAGMTAPLHHRGPDDTGIWCDPEAGVGLGHKRLAIIDLSPAGHQPMASACGRFVVVFNGEVYNHADLRPELEAKGYVFRGHSDTEVLANGFAAWGIKATIERCIGMFAIAAWDRRTRQLSLIRDRLGIKPLYYGQLRGSSQAGSASGPWVFGSELKALTAHPQFDRTIDTGALRLFLRHNYIPAPYSIYPHVKKLPPGTIATFQAKATGWPEPVPYWSLEEVAQRGFQNPFTASREEALERLHDQLRSAVKLRMLADVPLGAFLSGGIDSSLVVALMQEQSSQPIRTFTIGFAEAEYNEAPYAKAVAQHLGTTHTEHYVTAAESLNVIPKLARWFDEPFADSSQIPTFLVCELARQQVTVALSGDGGDELFCGYRRYFDALRLGRVTSLLPGFARAWGGQLLQGMSQQAGSFPRLQRNLRRGAKLLAESSPALVYARNMGHWPDDSAIMPGVRPANSLFSNWIASPLLPDLQASWMALDAKTYLPDDILTKVDRTSMAVALEARVPLIDHRVVELAWTLPLDWKREGRTGKLPLRSLLAQYVPRELFERPKTGFGVPIDAWLRGPLKEWADDLLSESRLERQGLFNSGLVRQKWTEHVNKTNDWHYWLWDVLMYQAWSIEHIE